MTLELVWSSDRVPKEGSMRNVRVFLTLVLRLLPREMLMVTVLAQKVAGSEPRCWLAAGGICLSQCSPMAPQDGGQVAEQGRQVPEMRGLAVSWPKTRHVQKERGSSRLSKILLVFLSNLTRRYNKIYFRYTHCIKNPQENKRYLKELKHLLTLKGLRSRKLNFKHILSQIH